MHIHIITIGKRPPTWIQTGYHHYVKQFPKTIQIQLTEVAPIKRTRHYAPHSIKQQETQTLIAHAPRDAITIALDRSGQSIDSTTLSQWLQSWPYQQKPIALFIGGPDGLDLTQFTRLERTWSLSPLTFPHLLVRVMLIEQLYRAWQIQQGHPYHR